MKYPIFFFFLWMAPLFEVAADLREVPGSRPFFLTHDIDYLMTFAARMPTAVDMRTDRSNASVDAIVLVGGRLYANLQVGRPGVPITPESAFTTRLIVAESGRWRELPSPVAEVRGIAAYSAKLLVVGVSTNSAVAPLSEIFSWDGTNWTSLASPFECNRLWTITAAGTNIFIGGDLTLGRGKFVRHLLRWDGTAWANIGSALEMKGAPGATWAKALAIEGNDLFVGGKFTRAGRARAINIARFDGENWSALGKGLGQGIFWEEGVRWIAFAGKHLLAIVDPRGESKQSLARWSGNKWEFPTIPWRQVGPMVPFGRNEVIAAARRTDRAFDPYAEVFRFDGSNAISLGEITFPVLKQRHLIAGTPGPGQILALATDGTNIYAGGVVSVLSMRQSPFVAKYAGAGWEFVGGGLQTEPR